MTSAVFVWPLACVALLVAYLALAPLIDRWRRPKVAVRRPEQAGLTSLPDSYPRQVKAEMPAAWAAAGLRSTEARPLPTVHAGGRPVGDGIEFGLSYPGWTADELRKVEERVAGALARRVTVGLVRIRPLPGSPGRGSITVARTHPLAAAAAYPVAPGRRPPGGRGLQVAIGRTEFLRPYLIDLTKTALWVGQNGSGKTVGVTDMLLGAATFPNVEITVYDGSVKGGTGYGDFGPRIRHGLVLKSKRGIVEDIGRIEASLRKRAEILDGRPYHPTPELPLRLVVIEEFPALDLEDDDLERVIHLAQQGRELGLAIHAVAQNPIGAIVDTVLRAELRQRVVFRVDGWRVADMGLGEGTRGGNGEDGYQPIPEQWPGVFDAVVAEESGVVRCRAFMPMSTLVEARAWANERGELDVIDWADPRPVALARIRAFVALHVTRCPKRPEAIDLVAKPRVTGARQQPIS